MIIQLIYLLLVILVFVYYVTVAIHLYGIKIFHKTDISIGKALIPFYYWFAREVVK